MRIKQLILIAAVAIAAASCAHSFEAEQTQQAAIGFGTWAEQLTKARTVGGTAFASGDKFYVLGFNTITSTSTNTNIFDGVTVSTTDGSAWTYSPKRFWDGNTDSYTFYAISPSEDVAFANLLTAHDVVAGTMTTASQTFSGKNTDILVADQKTVAKANYTNGSVLLNFRHAAAKFDLKVRKTANLADATVQVTAVSLENIENVGTMEVTGYAGSEPFNPTITWSTGATTEYGPTSGVNSVTIPLTVAKTPSSGEPETFNSEFLIQNLIVKPQTFATDAQRLKISYTITTGTGGEAQTITYTDKTVDLNLFDNTDYPTDDDEPNGEYNGGTKMTGWAQGTHYTYIVTIDANAINFSAQIQPWATVNGYRYLLN